MDASKSERGGLYDRDHQLREREVTLYLASVAAQTRAYHPEAKYIDFKLDENRDGSVDVQMNRVKSASGAILDHVRTPKITGFFNAPSQFGRWTASKDPKRDRIDIDLAIEAGEAEADRADREKKAAIASFRPTMKALRSQVSVLGAIDTEKRIEFSEDDGDTIQEAVVRHGVWTEDGEMATHTTDPRDGYVRLTMRSGWERWVPFGQLVDLHASERLFFNDHFGE